MYYVNSLEDLKLDCILDEIQVNNGSDIELVAGAKDLVKTGGLLFIKNANQPILYKVFGNHWSSQFCAENGLKWPIDKSTFIWTRVCRTSKRNSIRERGVLYDHYIELLEQNIPFSFLRYGDGEWNCALETIHPGYGLQTFTPEICKDIQKTLVEYHKDEHYYMTLAPCYHYLTRTGQWELLVNYIKENEIEDIAWGQCVVFNRASAGGRLNSFIRQLRQKNTIIVGPEKFEELVNILPDATYLTIPSEHCHSQLDEIQERILAQKLPAIILFSAGPACVVMIHNLYEEIGRHSTMIDIGSLWGPYVGIPGHVDHRLISQEVIDWNVA